MRALILPTTTAARPLEYPACLLGQDFRDLSPAYITEIVRGFRPVLIEQVIGPHTYHVFYYTGSQHIHQVAKFLGIHEVYHYNGSIDDLQARFQAMQVLVGQIDQLHTQIEAEGYAGTKRDPLTLYRNVCRRLYNAQHYRVELTAFYRETGRDLELRIYSVAAGSRVLLHKRYYQATEAAKIIQDIRLVQSAEAGIQFYTFGTEEYHTVYQRLVSNNSLYEVEFRHIVRLAHRRVYTTDIEVPGTECWYLINCATYGGKSLAMVTDLERFCPMRFTNSNTSIGILISKAQLSQAVDPQHVGPGDKRLIVEAIKHGLHRRATLDTAAGS